MSRRSLGEGGKELMNQPLQSFINLVTFDQSLLALKENIQHAEQEIKTLHQESQRLEEHFEEQKKMLAQFRKQVDLLEREVKELSDQEREKKQLLDQVKNNKEYQLLMKDLEKVHQRQLESETSLLTAWNSLENAQQDVSKRRDQYEHQKSEMNAKIDERTQELVQLKEQLASRSNARKSFLEGIPVEWLQKYALMQSRVGNPVVPEKRGSCSACHVSIPAQDMTQLRHKALIQCRNCYRFLYSEES